MWFTLTHTNTLLHVQVFSRQTKMNTRDRVILLSVLIASASAGSQPQECPEEWFDATIVSIFDQVVPVAELDNQIDPKFSFFKDVLKFSDKEIEEATQDAITFFDTKFGLDFSPEPDELGRRFYQNATFIPYRFPFTHVVTFNRWIVNGNTRTQCFPNIDGGFQVGFDQPQLLHGTYGGTEGQLINPGETLFWGFYSITVCPQAPLMVQFMSNTPDRIEPIDGLTAINCDVFHRTLGNGTGRGVIKVTPLSEEPEMVHADIRILFTFPKRPLIP